VVGVPEQARGNSTPSLFFFLLNEEPLMNSNKFHNHLIAINIPLASAHLMEMAIKVERSGCPGDFWMNLALEIEAGKYLSRGQVDGLVERFPFLTQFRA
jgi:hypothetical protein